MALPLALLPYCTPPYLKVTSAGLVPNAGGFVQFYETGTTTPQSTFTNSGGTVAHPNPIVLGASGWPNTGNSIFILPTGYTINVYDSDNNPATPGSVPYLTFTFVEDVGAAFLTSLGNIQTEGSKSVATSPYNVTVTDNLLTFDSTIANTVCQLPFAADRTADGGNGNPLIIKNVGASANVRVTPKVGETIDDGIAATTYINLPAAMGLTPIFAPTLYLLSNGVDGWYVASSHALPQA